MQVERVCPGCGTQWHGSMVKAEAVEKANDPIVTSQNTQPPEPSMKRKRKSYRESNADIAGCDSSVTSAAVSDMKRVTRSSARLSAN